MLFTIQVSSAPGWFIKSAARAGIDSWERAFTIILMVILWVLVAKCKAQGITKEAILCKYSRQHHCLSEALPPTTLAESLCAAIAIRCRGPQKIVYTSRFVRVILAQGPC